MPSIRTTISGGLTLALLAAGGLAASGHAAAAAGDQVFFQSVAGSWKGPGEVVAGKYKGTRFYCSLNGDPLKTGATGISMDGNCRVGVFTQKMKAVISKEDDGYSGHFLDGAKGDGLDVTSGRVSAGKVIVGLNRKQLYGAMVADLKNPNSMNVTISVQVGHRLVPVIGMTLARQDDQRTVGSIE